jgi:zinc/manganese transport system ATP-binding protein
MTSSAAAQARTTPGITLRNLTVSYRQHPALHHISGTFAPGSLTAVIGPNGSGKSTLLKSIAGLLPAACSSTPPGLPRLAIDIAPAHLQLAYLPQHSELDRNFPMNVHDCVLLGLWAQTGAWGSITRPMLAQVGAALQTVGLQGFERRALGTLSSGQLQRVLFARLVVQDAPLILLDEPFSAVDSNTCAALLALVQQWHTQGRTVVVVLHDQAQVRAHFPQALLLARECIVWGATPQVLSAVNLERARAMAEAWDDTAAICTIDGTLNGQDFDTLLAQRLASTAPS